MAVAPAAALLTGASPASAASGTWTGAVDATWANAGNWNPGPAPGTGDTATFNAAAASVNNNTTIDLGAGVAARTVLFDTANAGAYTIGAGAVGSQTLTLDDTGAVTMNATVANNQLFNANVTLGTAITSTYTFTNSSTTNTLTFAGNLQGGTGGTAGVKTLTVAGAGNTAITGNVAFGGATGITLTDTSAGTFTLSGTDTLTTLNLNGGANSVVDLGAGALTLNNAGGNSLQSTTGGTINATGGGSLKITGNTATDGGNLGTANGTTLTLNAKITSANSNAVEIFSASNGTGVVVFAGQNDYAGVTQINSNVLSVANVGVVGSTTSNLGKGAINFGNGANTGTLRYTGTGETSDRVITLTGTTSGGTIDQSGTGLLKFTSNFGTSGAGVKVLTLTGSTAGTGEIAGVINNNSTTNTTGVTKAGTGTWTLSGANTYSGPTLVSAGTLVLGNALAVQNSALTPRTGGVVFSSTVSPASFTVGALNGAATGNDLPLLNNAATPAPVALTFGGGVSGTYAGALSGAGGSLVKNGAGTQILSGTNTYTGTTAVNAGILQFGKEVSLYNNTQANWTAANISAALGGTLAFNVGGTGEFTAADIDLLRTNLDAASGGFASGSALGLDTTNAGGSFTYSTPITNTNGGANALGFTKLGTGTLVLPTAGNTYTGPTTIGGGTLALSGGANRLPTGTTLTFTGTGTLDLGGNSQTIAAMTFPNVTLTGTITNGSLTVNGTSDLTVGPNDTSHTTTLNLAGLSSFTFNSPTKTFRVGLPPGAGNGSATNQDATVTLSPNNTITAALFAVADQGLGGQAGVATLHLGQANTINATDVNVGFSNRTGALLDFNTGLTNPTVKFRALDGIAAVNTFNVGRAANNAATSYTDTADFSAGTVDLLATLMIVGSADAQNSTNRQGTVNGVFTLGAGTVTVGTLTVGQLANTGGGGTVNTGSTFNGNGTFNLNNAAGTLNATLLKLAENTITNSGGTARTVSGTFNLTNGTLKSASITKGPQTGTATSVALAFNWTNGTIQNADSSDLTIASVPLTLLSGTHTFNATGAQTITVDAASPIGGGGFTVAKTGTGTLNLLAANTYTGTTTVNGGRLLVNGSIAGPATVNGTAGGGADGATLGGTGSIAGNVTVNSGGVLAPGNSPGVLTITGTALTLASGSIYAVELGGNTPGNTASSYDQTNVTGAGSTANVAGSTLRVALQYAAAPSDTFTILTAGTVTGPFANAPVTAGNTGTFTDPVNGTTGTITYNPGSIVLSNVALGVPEPASLGLLACGALGLLARRRRRAGWLA